MRTLIVEDSSSARFFISSIAKQEGFEVKACENGAEALKTFKEFKPEIIISDILMPVMDGLQLLEEIRKKDHVTPFIIISSMDSPEYTLKALRLQANDYLVKPFKDKDLYQILEKYRRIINARSVERDVIGMLYHKSLGLRIKNNLDLVEKIVDRLVSETDDRILPRDRLGIRVGLVEIITNSIEHGNLGISFQEKREFLNNNPKNYLDFVTERDQMEPFRSRRTQIEFAMNSATCEWTISDQGDGFDFKNLPDPTDPENLLQEHGRGILLSKFYFDEVEYQEKGNVVRLVKKLS
ncbi:MAG: response regulator [Candidatus Riflebacteria bacterium]|nr:response regulator [Candidatus Riflebacteria bacterium]